jgi:hypothetical protein
MAHYAKVENGIVTEVIVADSITWCEETLGGEWVQTSYNTHGGTHKHGKLPIHKNYAGIGYTFDGVGFAAPQPYPSWTLNKETYLWEPPIERPEEAWKYIWSEEDQEWVEITVSE